GGAQADLVVINAKRGADAFRTIVEGTWEGGELGVIDGQRRFGTPDLMSGASTVTTLTVGSRPMQLSLSQPSDASKAWEWSEVIDRMEEVRAHPKREVEAANAMYARWAGRLDDLEAPAATGPRYANWAGTGWRFAQGSQRSGYSAAAEFD